MHFSFKKGHKHIYSLFAFNWDWRNWFNSEKGVKVKVLTLQPFISIVLLSRWRPFFSPQHAGSSLLHIWDTVWLRILVCIPAITDDPGALFSTETGFGQRRGDGRQQPLFYGDPCAAQESGGTAGPSKNLPDPQHLHAGSVAAGFYLQTAHAQWDVHDARHGNGRRAPVRPGVGEQVAEGPVQNQKVL